MKISHELITTYFDRVAQPILLCTKTGSPANL
jgi:hypothetical protein